MLPQKLLTTTIFSGSFLPRYNYPDGQTKESLSICYPHLELIFKGGTLTIGDNEGQMPDKILDIKACLVGLALMAEKYREDFADFLSQDDDANTSDIFLQLALYGEVIFG